MPKPRIFTEEFRNSEHNKRKPHAHGKPREYRRKACHKCYSPQVFKLANSNNGGISFVLFRNFACASSRIQVDWPKGGNENDESGGQVKCRQNGDGIRDVNVRRNRGCKSRNGLKHIAHPRNRSRNNPDGNAHNRSRQISRNKFQKR